jgi:hypothetical protein
MQGIEPTHVALVIRVLAYAQKSPAHRLEGLQQAAAPLKDCLAWTAAFYRVLRHVHELRPTVVKGRGKTGATRGTATAVGARGRAADGAAGVRAPTSKKV